MCLDINKFSRAKIAKEDITCYKWVFVHVLSASKKEKIYDYVTPFFYSHIKIGETYNSILEVRNKYNPLYRTEIHSGLHSYADFHTPMSKKWGYSVIIKCIIPKGSKYYVGKFDGDKGYASDSLKYVKILETISD